MSNIIVYDLEIKKRIDGIEVTWDDHDKMGISTLVAYDYNDKRFHVYMDDNINDFIERLLVPGTHIVTFNGKHFDDKVLASVQGSLYPTEETNTRHIDLLEEIIQITERRAKLDDVLRETLGAQMVKSGSGAFAPELWAAGKIGELIDYNLVDTLRTKQLFEFVSKHGYMIVYGRIVNIDTSSWLK